MYLSGGVASNSSTNDEFVLGSVLCRYVCFTDGTPRPDYATCKLETELRPAPGAAVCLEGTHEGEIEAQAEP